ncbi:B-cell receptor CD22-like [Alosa pseudoharengus]|uniref:B-cell receptor CD22-like n=1 Tax=Alosa pseudoharengus TaxID=34774 RepID=UPI003F8A78E5
MCMLVVLFLLSLPAVQGGGSVTYSTTRVCGLKGASVVLPCKYDYSLVGHYIEGEWYEQRSGRVRRHNPPDYDCSLKIDKLSDDHSGVYQFRFYTTLDRSWITGRSGVALSITDLQVKEEAVVGNQNQTKVTCSTSCSLGSQYVWYKNGQPLQDETTASILLDSTRPSEEGSYSCAVRGYEGHRSPTVSLQVFIPPEAVTEGERVTLTCDTTCRLSKDPIFIWYKNGQPVTYEHTTRDNKLHLNSVSIEDAGSYSCSVRGHESLSSNNVFLNVRWESISFNVTSDTSGLYHCEAQNEVGSRNSTGVAVPSKG